MRTSLSKTEILALYKKRQGFWAGGFWILWAQSRKSAPRVSFAFARHVGKAHLRNLFRRRLRALLQTELAGLGVDFLITARAPLASITKTLWEKQRNLLKKICHEKIESSLHSAH